MNKKPPAGTTPNPGTTPTPGTHRLRRPARRRRLYRAAGGALLLGALLFMPLGATSAGAATVSPAITPAGLQWAVDTAAPMTAANLNVIRAAAGGTTPPVWFRYFSNCYGGCTTVTRSEIAFAHSQGITVGLISADPETGDTGSAAGANDAAKAIADAVSLGVPKPALLIKDVETSTPIDGAFINAWYTAVSNSGYTPGWYGNTVTGAFTGAFCNAVNLNANVRGSVIDTPITSLLSVGVGPGGAPSWTRSKWPDCGGRQGVYQYNLASQHPLFDQDLVDPSVGGLWSPDGSITSLYRLGAPSDAGSPAAGGWRMSANGVLSAFGAAPAASVSGVSAGTARAIAAAPSIAFAGVVLTGDGMLHPFNGLTRPTDLPSWTGGDAARDVVLVGDGHSGYELDLFGGLHPFGGAPPISSPPAYRTDGDWARRVVLRNDGVSGYVLYRDGMISAFGGAPAVASVPVTSSAPVALILSADQRGANVVMANGSIIAPGGGVVATGTSAGAVGADSRADGSAYLATSAGDVIGALGAPAISVNASGSTTDVALMPGLSGYTADKYGGIHPFGGAPTAFFTAYWPGWDIVRGIVAAPGGGGYVLDGFGGIHGFGTLTTPAPTVAVSAYWPGWDAARGLVLIPGSNSQGYVLDLFGGLHPFGGAPPAVVTAYWAGWDIARSLTMLPDGSGGYVMDGFGGMHPFAVAGHAMPPNVSNISYWGGNDVGAGVSAVSATAVAQLDRFGGMRTSSGGSGSSWYWGASPRIVGVSCNYRYSWCVYAENSNQLHTNIGTPTPDTPSTWTFDLIRAISVIVR